jgi:hypothetical protein
MSKVDARVALDATVLRGVDEEAARLGRSRDQVIEDSVRRGLAARTLSDIFTRVRESSDLSEEQAETLAYEELAASRSAQK